MWSFYSEVTYKRVILNKAISEVQSTRQHIREWGKLNKATYMRVIVDKAISEVQLTRHLKDAYAIVDPDRYSCKITALMINNNISMSIKIPKVTRLFRFCDFSNVVAFGHNELWRIINASPNLNNYSISAHTWRLFPQDGINTHI